MIAGRFSHVGLHQVQTKLSCTQLMKAYAAETSCNQLVLIDQFHYIHAYQDQFARCHNARAMSLYIITTHVPTYNPHAGVGVSRLDSCKQYIHVCSVCQSARHC